jgi:hypothetical protein
MTTSPAVGVSSRSAAVFGTWAMVCFVYAILGLILLHVLRPDYGMKHMISDYAVGPYGWVMQTVFIAMSIGTATLLLGMVRGGPTTVTARIALALLAVASVGLVVSAIFPTDLPGGPSTPTGNIHTFSFLVNISSIILAVVLLTASFGGDPRWRSYRGTSAVLLSAIILAFVVQFLTLRKGAPYGLANVFFVAVLFAWFLATANQLRNLARE